MLQLQISLNPSSELDLRWQLYHRIRQLVTSKELQPGQRMSSSRELADQLKVSRKTVKAAYRQLIIEGFLESRPRSGTYVPASVQGTNLALKPTRSADALPPFVKRLSNYGNRVSAESMSWTQGSNAADISFFSWQPVFNQYPPGNWQTILLAEFNRSTAHFSEAAEHPFGLRRMREEIARWVLKNREISCEPEQVAVIAGYGQALDLVARIHCSSSDVVALEDPTYPPARELFQTYGASILSVPVDLQGLQVEKLGSSRRRSAEPKVLLVTPAHQFPTGAVLTMQRRLDLLAWAQRVNCLVLEDDYDAEFNFDGQPAPALSALYHNGTALYLGSFKKLLPPPFAIDFMIVPKQLVSVYAHAMRLSAGQISAPIQSAVATFMSQGELDKQVRRLRTMYGKRRKALLAAIVRHLEKKAEVAADNVGLHVIIKIMSRYDDDELTKCASQVGVELISTRSFHAFDPGQTGEFVLAYATLSEEEIEEGIKRLAQLIK
ncbi:MAG: PLP-dependent aminotransferase family protein [Candidatus Obscuribacterales bacterium]|nr:PLP-dependent aminotransferase family protein [Candidatus Obscuribacterales bacterium]